MSKKLRVIVMTQNDKFFIPTNIRKASTVCDIIEVVQVDCKHSLDNKLKEYLKWFGFWQCAKMGVVSTWYKIKNIFDAIFKYKVHKGSFSVKGVSKYIGTPFKIITNSNSPEFIEHVRELNPDLIISYSAPQIIKETLLSVPKYGIINVHGSLLPDYRGCFPSFWYLFNDEKVGGATVHYMSAKIDDGAIIRQDSVDISNCKSMFQIMKKTKYLGGELMMKAIEDIANESVNAVPNDTNKGRYFTWPTVEQGKEFRKKGKKLI